MRTKCFITAIFTLIVFLFVTACAPSSAESFEGSEAQSNESWLEENQTPFNGDILCSPKEVEALSSREYKSDELAMIMDKAILFATRFTPFVYQNYDEDNLVISPISIFMVLGMLAECSNGQTREQILSALDLSLEDLQSAYSLLYRLLDVDHKEETEAGDLLVAGKLEFSNSIWLDNDLSTNENCLTSLGDNYYSNAIAVDFGGKNEEANNNIRQFIKKQTHGLIDKEHKFSEETLLAIINTLYLNDLWDYMGDPLQKTAPISFTSANGTQKNMQMLKGRYVEGQVYQAESYSGFYTRTSHGYKLKFIVPNEGYTVDQIFTQENLQEFNSVDSFNAIDVEKRIRYYTRCFFPEYNVSYDEDIKNLLSEYFGITNLFNLGTCDFSGLTEEAVYCNSIKHTTTLNVNELGVEGAAVTVAELAGSAGPDDYTEVFLDFVVNKAFGFMITDPTGVVVFSGVVNTL